MKKLVLKYKVLFGMIIVPTALVFRNPAVVLGVIRSLITLLCYLMKNPTTQKYLIQFIVKIISKKK